MKRNNIKNTILTIILSFIGIIIFIIASTIANKYFITQNSGQIQVQLIDIKGTIVVEKEIEFNKGDTLPLLLEENFDNVVIENGMLMSIDTFTTAPDWSTFISIYVDNEISQVGILDIKFTDGTIISFVMSELIL